MLSFSKSSRGPSLDREMSAFDGVLRNGLERPITLSVHVSTAKMKDQAAGRRHIECSDAGYKP
jgi:hypothetical protein